MASSYWQGINVPGWIKRYFTTTARLLKLEDAIGGQLGGLLGCGHFGCVFEFVAPWVVKITRDPTEGRVWKFIKDHYDGDRQFGRDGVVSIARVIRLHPDIRYRLHVR